MGGKTVSWAVSWAGIVFLIRNCGDSRVTSNTTHRTFIDSYTTVESFYLPSYMAKGGDEIVPCFPMSDDGGYAALERAL